MLRPLVAFALVATACHRAPTAPTTPPSNKAEPVAVSGAVDDVLGFLPANSDIVVGVDGTALRASALWQKFEPQIVAGLGDNFTRMRENCGFDPIRSIERVGVGGRVGDDGKFDGVMVFRGVSGAKTLDCIASELRGKATVTNDRGVLTVDRGGNDKFVATIVGSSTLVAHFSATATGATLDAVVRSGAPLRTSPAFMTLFDRRETDASVWGMVNGNSSLLNEMSQAGAKPKGVDGTLTIRDKFIAAVRVTYASPAEADQMLKAVQPVGQMVGGRLEKLDFAASGAVVRADMVATDEQLRALLGMFGGMF